MSGIGRTQEISMRNLFVLILGLFQKKAEKGEEKKRDQNEKSRPLSALEEIKLWPAWKRQFAIDFLGPEICPELETLRTSTVMNVAASRAEVLKEVENWPAWKRQFAIDFLGPEICPEVTGQDAARTSEVVTETISKE